MLNRFAGMVPVAMLSVWLCSPVAAQEGVGCENLEDLKIEDTNLLSSAVVPADGDLPEYCRVLGYVRPAINFEIRLPTQDWNGKFYMVGCGAWCGRLRPDLPGFSNAPNHGLRRGYATATTDAGHWGSSIWDTTWFQIRDPIALFDFAQRAIPATARVTKEMIAVFYGKPPERSYFAGCSTGGRQAHMEAWKYPEDFDGIISGCPALRAAENTAEWAWNVVANTGPDGGPIFDPSKLPILVEAVYAACAGDDGLIEDPDACQFDPADLACAGEARPTCLSAAEVATVEKWYDGPRDSEGNQIYPGLARGSEAYWLLWRAIENEETWRGDQTAVENELRRFSFPEQLPPDYDLAQFDFNEDPARMIEAYADMEAGSGLDLSSFRDRGGKLLIYHGLADGLIPSDATRQWYGELAQAAGGEAAVMEFARLFLVPGMDHCGIQSGPGVHHSGFDPLPALEKWVEEGIPPESIVMTKTDDAGQTEWTRPVCVFPNVAKYDGTGDIADAMSWSCGPGA